VVVREADGDAVGELGDLDDEEGKLVALVVDSAVEREEGPDEGRNVGVGRDDVGEGDAVGNGVEDLAALAGAVDGDGAAHDLLALVVAVLLGGEAAGDGVVNGQRGGEGSLEVVDELGGGDRRRREEEAVLEVVGGEQGEVPDGERDALARPGRRPHRAPRCHAHRRRRHGLLVPAVF